MISATVVLISMNSAIMNHALSRGTDAAILPNPLKRILMRLKEEYWASKGSFSGMIMKRREGKLTETPLHGITSKE